MDRTEHTPPPEELGSRPRDQLAKVVQDHSADSPTVHALRDLATFHRLSAALAMVRRSEGQNLGLPSEEQLKQELDAVTAALQAGTEVEPRHQPIGWEEYRQAVQDAEDGIWNAYREDAKTEGDGGPGARLDDYTAATQFQQDLDHTVAQKQTAEQAAHPSSAQKPAA